MSVLSIQRTKNGVLESADSATISVASQAGVIVIPPTAVTPTSAGVYSYDTPPLAAGNYTASWTFVVAGYTNDVVIRTFQVETTAAISDGITLAEIEQAIASRIGPYDKVVAHSSSSETAVVVSKLISTIDSGDYEDRYLLRRGFASTGEYIVGFTETDRQRSVAEYLSSIGRLSPDNAWTNAPEEGESLELHYLEPEALREVAREGLRRCYFWDTIEISSNTYLSDINVTLIAPWITRPSQIRRVQHGRYAYQTQNVLWFEPYQMGRSVWLRITVPNIGAIRIEALRPHFSFVNETYSAVGPNNDSDVLSVDREYAARAGHVAAWMMHTPRLTPVAVQGLAIPMAQAAAAFTVASMTYVKTTGERIQTRFGFSDLTDFGQIGNG